MDILGYYEKSVHAATNTHMQLILKKEPFLQLVHADPALRKTFHIELGPPNGTRANRFACFGGKVSVYAGPNHCMCKVVSTGTAGSVFDACETAKAAQPHRLLHPAMPISLTAPAKQVFLSEDAA